MKQWKELIKKNAGLLIHITIGMVGCIALALLYEPLIPFQLFMNIFFLIILVYFAVEFTFGNQKKHWKWKCFLVITLIIAMNHLYDYQIVLNICPFLGEYSPAVFGGSVILIIICIFCSVKILRNVDWGDLISSNDNKSVTKINSKWFLFFSRSHDCDCNSTFRECLD